MVTSIGFFRWVVYCLLMFCANSEMSWLHIETDKCKLLKYYFAEVNFVHSLIRFCILEHVVWLSFISPLYAQVVVIVDRERWADCDLLWMRRFDGCFGGNKNSAESNMLSINVENCEHTHAHIYQQTCIHLHTCVHVSLNCYARAQFLYIHYERMQVCAYACMRMRVIIQTHRHAYTCSSFQLKFVQST